MFRSRLEKESSFWVESGWLSLEARERILGHYPESRSSLLIRSVAAIGILLLTVGIISFFAANWQAMPKIVRLAVLFLFLWGSYMSAGFCLDKNRLPRSGHALLVLGIIAYGTAIMLVAQTYHISAHFPDGILLWMLGALLTAWLMKSEAAAVVGVLLSLIWSGTEIFHFQRLHLPWLIFALPAAACFVRQQWQAAFNAIVIGLYIWLTMMLLEHNDLFIYEASPIWLLMMFAILMVLCGRLMSGLEFDAQFGQSLSSWSLLVALSSGWALSFPDLLERVGGETWFQVANGVLITGIGAVAWLDLRKVARLSRRRLQLVSGIIFIVVFITLNLFLYSGILAAEHGGQFVLLFNLVYFLALAWLIVAASHEGNTSYLNLGFLFLGLWLVARYFDTFWELLDRSLFFLAGGILFLVVAIVLERKRRQLVGNLMARDGSG